MGDKTIAARGRLGAVTRRHPDQADLIAAALSELAAAKHEEYVERAVDAAPLLTAEQRLKIIGIVAGGDAA